MNITTPYFLLYTKTTGYLLIYLNHKLLLTQNKDFIKMLSIVCVTLHDVLYIFTPFFPLHFIRDSKITRS